MKFAADKVKKHAGMNNEAVGEAQALSTGHLVGIMEKHAALRGTPEARYWQRKHSNARRRYLEIWGTFPIGYLNRCKDAGITVNSEA